MHARKFPLVSTPENHCCLRMNMMIKITRNPTQNNRVDINIELFKSEF